MGESRGIQSIEVGFRLLRALQESPGPASLTDLARRAQMSATKAHYYLTSFVRLGLIAQDERGGHYDLGPQALRLGLAALERTDTLAIARDEMFAVRDATGQAVFLSVWGNRGPTVVHRLEGFHLSPLSIRVGSVLEPLSATGRAILSTFDDAVVRDILTDVIDEAAGRDVAALDQMVALVDDARRDGFARGRRTVAAESGFVGLAAPIVTFDRASPAALTINGHANDFDMTPAGRNVRALLAATARIAERAGGPTPVAAGSAP